MRPIALTEIWSKLFESVVRPWILDDIKTNISINQYGGLSGVGTQQYFMTMTHHVLAMAEEKKSALTLLFDFSSAFNCLEHTKVISAAESLGVRPSILALLSNYLDTRTNVVRWGNGKSHPIHCRGGSGQGTLLSVLLFLITIDPLLKRLEAEINQREVGFRTKSKVMAFVDDINLTVALDPKSYPVMDGGSHA